MARNLVRFDPFADLDAFEKRFFENGPWASMRGVRLPVTDVYTEDDKQLTVEAHLPDFEDKDISVDVDRGALVIQAEKHEKDEDKRKNKKYILRESSSSYYRRITLPEAADEDHVSAKFDHGVLKVTVPFKKAAAPKKVEIASGGK